MAATLKSLTAKLNYLERLRHEFPDMKQLNQQTVVLQVSLATVLVTLLNAENARLGEANFINTDFDAIKRQDKVALVKAFRERYGYGLGEAKNIVEELLVQKGYAHWHQDSTGYKTFIWGTKK